MGVDLKSPAPAGFFPLGPDVRSNTPASLILLVTTEVVATAFAIAFGWSESSTLVFLLVLTIPIGVLARRLPCAVDRWLGSMIVLGFVAKLVASGVRYLALEIVYGGRGDASGYHNHGVEFAPLWRSGQIPDFEFGTEFVQVATGFLYVPYVPTMLGGFLIFATLAFLGQILLYSAFRHVNPSSRIKWYGLLIFFYPTMLYWPSSIGKESLMTLFIGLTCYGTARLFTSLAPKWMVVAGVGLMGCAVIRSHIALLLAVSLTTALAIGRFRDHGRSGARRIGVLTIAIVALAGAVLLAGQDFGVDFTQGISETVLEDEIEPIFAGVEQQTSRGGSAVAGNALESPAYLPEAVVRVVFKPLPMDAHNLQALISSLFEGTLLLILIAIRLPAIIRNLTRTWRSPYVTFSLVYTAGFIFGHSAILNLGIVARQRSQLIPFLMVLLVELGAKVVKEEDPAPALSQRSELPVVVGSHLALATAELPSARV